ncbi:signal peptidase complex subunit SPC2 TDEL_0D01110 [Torulaspora delbrueckii]|uniref:Signal peptidase complex subunit 2 n=1 Tax=Torulaspora delbrueckii TaxID=4950 RepID=G8ZSV1_TORDE|nr:hypothetical protein TDEL_0D01110 [Torulaspora delbrueckii]CCE91695.1 hypothetical protein TDEL_0D01110 [Torulaspora delbrueckii]
MSKPINVYSIPELRQTLDEALPATFARLKYKQSFQLIDAKLVLGYSMAAIAAGSFLLDKKFKYSQVVGYQKALLVIYGGLSVLYWYFTKYIEKSTVYEGRSPAGEKVSVKTRFEKKEPIYLVDFRLDDKTEVSVGLPATEVFNEAGYLQNELLFQWLERQLKVLSSKKSQ